MTQAVAKCGALLPAQQILATKDTRSEEFNHSHSFTFLMTFIIVEFSCTRQFFKYSWPASML